MHVSGSIRDFQSLKVIQNQLQAHAIFFISPNVILMTGRNPKEYAFFKTGLLIESSFMVSNIQFRNMFLYMKQGEKRLKNSPFTFDRVPLSTVIFTESSIRFVGSEDFQMEVPNAHSAVPKDMELKLDRYFLSSFDQEAPFYKIPFSGVCQLLAVLKEHKPGFGSGIQSRYEAGLFNRHNQLSMKIIRKREVIEFDTGVHQFDSNKVYETLPFRLSEPVLRVLNTFTHMLVFDDLTILNTKEFSIMEGNSNGLAFKIRTYMKSSTL
ncbi:hypothetical protein ACQKJG_18525 [Priestia megaterium]|uniref:hypothetical protein n=1 Tax=Priestia megaterium TaxID=1404 RepID=UPI003D052E38